MRYRVQVPGMEEETVEAYLVEVGPSGALLFWDEAHYLKRAFAAGRWVTLTLIEEERLGDLGNMRVTGGTFRG